jgi:PAS domain-containing protein
VEPISGEKDARRRRRLSLRRPRMRRVSRFRRVHRRLRKLPASWFPANMAGARELPSVKYRRERFEPARRTYRFKFTGNDYKERNGRVPVLGQGLASAHSTHRSVCGDAVNLRRSWKRVAGCVYGTGMDRRARQDQVAEPPRCWLRQVIDAIPTLAWCNLPDGPNEFLNKRWHEYTGLSAKQSNGWGWQVAFHPEDLPLLMEKWRELL